SGDDLDQGRLAGPVVADERVHLLRPEREVTLAQRDDTPEVLLDVPRFEQGWQRRWRRHRRDDIVVLDSMTIPERRRARQAAGVGFEPTDRLATVSGFQDRPVRPLRHPAVCTPYRCARR